MNGCYVSDKWQEILSFNGLDSYEKLWALEADWFEEPNYKRAGWSGVSRIELDLPLGGKIGAFLKRQEDYFTRSLRHPIKGRLTIEKECEVIRTFQQNEIPSLELMFFDSWKDKGHKRAVILTVELAGYIPLTSDEYQTGGLYFRTKSQKQVLFKKLADLMHVMHKNNFEHGCFYPNHVFAARLPKGEIDLRVIDLEKVKKTGRKHAQVQDFFTFIRRAVGWSDDDKKELFKSYRNETELSPESKKLWRKINQKVEKKTR